MKLKRSILITLLSATVLTFGGINSANAATKYHRTKTTPVSHKKYHSFSENGKTYRPNGSTTRFTFKANHYLLNYRTTTWTRTHKTYITKHGEKYLYYYVRNDNKKNVSGWVWSGYLEPGKYVPPYTKYKSMPNALKGYYVPRSAKFGYHITYNRVTRYYPKSTIQPKIFKINDGIRYSNIDHFYNVSGIHNGKYDPESGIYTTSATEIFQISRYTRNSILCNDYYFKKVSKNSFDRFMSGK